MSEALQEAKLAAAAGVVEDMLGDTAAAEPAEVLSEQPAPAAEAETEDTEFDFAPVDLEELGLDFEDETPAPVAEEEDEYLPDEYEQDAEKERAARVKAEKRAKYLEEQLVNSKIKGWRKEAERKFSLADVDTITATSKRAFMRAAALDHNKSYARLKPHLDALAAERAKLRGEAETEARTETAAAWGKPTAGPGVGPIQQGEQNARVDAAREKGLRHVIKEMLKSHEYNPFAEKPRG